MPRKRRQKYEERRTAKGPRASWRGTLRFGLVSFQVHAVNAHHTVQGSVAFHQLHGECHRRIRYQKVCPTHGPVTQDEIVSGYEYSKGHYVEFDPDELDALRTEAERALHIDAFVEPGRIDPLYYDGRMYFLVPAGEEEREPYAILLDAMRRKEVYAVGQIVFSGKEQLVIVRPMRHVLHMALLNYFAEMRHGEDVVGDLPHISASDKKVRLATQLVDSWRDEDFDIATTKIVTSTRCES